MTKRPRRSRRGYLWPLSRARRCWPNWPNNSMYSRTRSRPGDRSFSKGLRGLWRRDETRFRSAPDRCENAARQDRGVDTGTRFFVRSARESRTFAERKAMIDRNDDLPVSRQAKVVGISRGSVYYQPRTVSADVLVLMRRIDELHLDYPFAGSRMLQTFLVREGYDVGRLHVATLMKRMGIEAIYRPPNTSKPAPGHAIFPYLLRKLPVTRPNQVWAMDITYHVGIGDRSRLGINAARFRTLRACAAPPRGAARWR